MPKLDPVLAALGRSEEHTSELQSLRHLVCRLLLEKNLRMLPQREYVPTRIWLRGTEAAPSWFIAQQHPLCQRHVLLLVRPHQFFFLKGPDPPANPLFPPPAPRPA